MTCCGLRHDPAWRTAKNRGSVKRGHPLASTGAAVCSAGFAPHPSGHRVGGTAPTGLVLIPGFDQNETATGAAIVTLPHGLRGRAGTRKPKPAQVGYERVHWNYVVRRRTTENGLLWSFLRNCVLYIVQYILYSRRNDHLLRQILLSKLFTIAEVGGFEAVRTWRMQSCWNGPRTEAHAESQKPPCRAATYLKRLNCFVAQRVEPRTAVRKARAAGHGEDRRIWQNVQ